MPSVEGLGARHAALQFLDSVLRRGLTLDVAATRNRNLSAPDHSLALAIAGEVLRRIPDLDALIDSTTRQRLPDDSKARMVLRMALAQKIALHTPDHALIATALPLVDGGPRKLVHGVLGTLLRRGLPSGEAPRLPPSVEERWSASWGEDVVFAARRQIGSRPKLDLSFADDREAQAYSAANRGVSLAAGHVRIESSSVADLPGYEAGGWWVQDFAASLPARLVPASSKDVLDLCAAPGGKAMQLAAAGHMVTALDSSRSRLGRLTENLKRTKLEARLVEADALQWEPDRAFDSVLLDAPCSATGTFRRHPEVLYRARPKTIADNSEIQTRLLRRAAKWVRPGGTLVYSVCSLEPEEGERLVRSFLDGNSEFDVTAPDRLPKVLSGQREKWVRILPGLLESEGGLDGFFMVRLVRRG